MDKVSVRSLSQHKSTSSIGGSLNSDEIKLYELALTAGFQMEFEVFKYGCLLLGPLVDSAQLIRAYLCVFEGSF